MRGRLNRWIWIMSSAALAAAMAASTAGCTAAEGDATPAPPAEPTLTASPMPTPIPTFAGRTVGLFATLQADTRFSILVELIEAAAYAETLEHEGAFTFFAPGNIAFEALPEGTVESWLDPANAQQAADLLSYHLATQTLSARELGELDGVESALSGHRLLLRQRGDELLVNNVRVLIGDIPATNGVIHMIEYVLQPAP